MARESTAHETTTDSEFGLDTAKLTYASFYRVFTQSVRQYNQGIGTTNPDLSAFRKAGGKLLSWKGRAPATLATRTTSSTGAVTATRNACPYPQVARYDGHGDPRLASSYRCAN